MSQTHRFAAILSADVARVFLDAVPENEMQDPGLGFALSVSNPARPQRGARCGASRE